MMKTGAHFLSVLDAEPMSRDVSPLCSLSAYPSLGDVGDWITGSSALCDRKRCVAAVDVAVRLRICCTAMSTCLLYSVCAKEARWYAYL